MSDPVADAQTLYTEALDALREQRQQIEDDLEFSDPSDPQQWDADERRRRETDPGGARPCLVLDQCGQYTSNVAGQTEKSPPAIHALPVDGGSDKKVAEQLDGYFRHIEHTSRAQQHYSRAGLSAARTGVGYLTVRPEYIDRALGYQEPRIGSEGDPLRVVLDPYSVELDGSDATFGFILTPLSAREFKRKYPTAEASSFGETEQKKSRDERDSVMLAECWTIEDKTENHIQFLDRRGDEVALTEDDFWLAQQRGEVMQVLRTFKETARKVWWRRMNGCEVLDTCTDADGKESPFPADHIGIIPVYGYVGWSAGRMHYCGIPRRARSAQQAYNFHKSEERAFILTGAKAPWTASRRAIAGLEKQWDRASVEQRAYLPYNDIDDLGAISAPQRTQISVNLQNHIEGAQQALRDIQASIGMYQANLGAPSNESSGVAIESRKQQGEASTAHFPANLAASIGQVGNLCLAMIPRLMDTKRRMRIMGIDGTPSHVTVNPGQSEAVQETPDGLSINPNIGRYDVRVVVGAAYSTQRSQASAAFTEMMRANPAMAPAIAPIWAQMQDIPHADKLAQALIAMAPPEVQAVLKPEGDKDAPNTADLQGKLQQMQQALQEAIQHAKDAQQEALDAHQALEDKAAEQEDRERELNIKAYEAETKRLTVTGANEAQLQALVQQLLNNMLTSPNPLGDEASAGMQGQMPQPEPMEPGEGEPASYEMQPLPMSSTEGQQ